MASQDDSPLRSSSPSCSRRGRRSRGSMFVTVRSSTGKLGRSRRATKKRDTLLAYRRIEPPHVTKMDAYGMGQISQVWGVLETSAEPIDTSWYAGRDIGALGFYTDVRVFDTAGLVTREVSHSTEWAARQDPRRATRRDARQAPIAADLFEGWGGALGKQQAFMRDYR